MGVNVKSPISRLVFAAVVAALTAVAAGGAPAATEATRTPAVTVLSETPVVVAGRGFRGLERIVVRVVAGEATYRRTLRAARNGRFRTTFAQTDASCLAYTVTAVGARGSRATQTRKFRIPPPCGPAPQP